MVAVPVLRRPGATGREGRETGHHRRRTGGRVKWAMLPGAAVVRQPPPGMAVPIAATGPGRKLALARNANRLRTAGCADTAEKVLEVRE